VLQYVTELQRRLFLKNQSGIASFKWRSPGAVPVDSSLAGNGKDFDASQLMGPNERKQNMNDADMFSGSAADDLPFEFRALEVALEAACTFLDTQVQLNLLHKHLVRLMFLSSIPIVYLS
jgi:magnesium transporter